MTNVYPNTTTAYDATAALNDLRVPIGAVLSDTNAGTRAFHDYIARLGGLLQMEVLP